MPLLPNPRTLFINPITVRREIANLTSCLLPIILSRSQLRIFPLFSFIMQCTVCINSSFAETIVTNIIVTIILFDYLGKYLHNFPSLSVYGPNISPRVPHVDGKSDQHFVIYSANTSADVIRTTESVA